MQGNIQVSIDLGVIRRNAQKIAALVPVPMYAVVKADAYGLGARQIVETIADLISGICVFSLEEARRDSLWDLCRKPILALGPAGDVSPADFLASHVHPTVWTLDQARRFAPCQPAICVDLGMQRFACPLDEVEAVLKAGECRQAFTHALRVEQAIALSTLLGGRGLTLHAAGSGLLDEPRAWLDAVRPGIALYRGATRITTTLLEVRKSTGPAGYRGIVAERLGVIRGGYARGLRPGPCLINSQRRAILEVGMQSAFVEVGPNDRAGDEVVLLGETLSESAVANAWQTSEQEALVCLARAGDRTYRAA